jgi:hypothetical protein
MPKTIRLFMLVGAIAGWVAIALQFYLLMANRTQDVPQTIIQFFSYFTILTNILVAIYFTVLLFNPKSSLAKFLSKSDTTTAITVYITVVGLVYNVILRYLWQPLGAQKVVDELLHSVIPLLFILYWFLFVPKGQLKWKNAFPWLIYPFIYSLYILLRGAWSGRYPYPFIDAKSLGYYKVGLNSGVLFLTFLTLSLLFIGIGKMMSRNKVMDS